jgi:ABC-type uncharacterized transport system auxiliary subunit
MKYFLIMIVTFFIGCTTKEPAVTEYRVFVKSQKKVQHSKCKDKTLRIIPTITTPDLMTEDMRYVLDDIEENSFTKSSWNQPLNTAISAELVKLLNNSSLFRYISVFKSIGNSDYLLESRLDDFKQYFYSDKNESYVKVDLTLTLLDKKTSKIIGQKRFFIKKDINSIKAKDGVKALNESLDEIFKEVIFWLRGLCK